VAPLRHRRRFALGAHLALLVACAVIPILLFSTVLVIRIAAEERRQVERNLLDISRTLAAALDRELLVTVGVLEFLAHSPTLASGNLAAFHAEATRLVARQSTWQSVLVISADGQQLMNTSVPWGTSLPRANEPASLDELVRSGKPVVGALAVGKGTGQLAFPVRVPLIHEGRVVAVLTAAVRPESLQELLVTAFPPRGEWTRAFNDPNGLLAARSRDPEKFVGQPGNPEFVRRLQTAPEGFFRTTTIDGEDAYVVYSRAPFSRWSAGMAFPTAVVDGPLRRSLALTLGIGLALTAVTGAAAYLVGRRIARPIRAATEAAQALTRGDDVPVAASSVREVADLGTALGHSAYLLRGREAERDDLLAKAQAARTEAEGANRAKDEFLAMLGHELRNPIGAATTAAAILRHTVPADGVAGRAVGVITRQMGHLARLVDDLLDVGRVTGGKIALARAPLDLGEVARRVLATFEGTGHTQGRHVVLACEPVWIDGDAARMEQVITNLLSNALKFTEPGGTVEVRTTADGPTAVLTVADTGAGIAPDVLPRVFDLFVQAEASLDRAQGGLGIGLTLVRELVELHGGSVEAASAGPGKGSTFVVRLPRIGVPTAVRETPAPEPARGRRRILIVEDNADGREMLRASLELAGHEVEEAEDGPAGIDAARARPPDLAIIDIGLPGIDGYEVARRIHADGAAQTKLVALTGYGQPDDRRRAQEAGFAAHITKPVEPQDLLELIEMLTRR
jgi:signal transduction histidine kinase